MNEKEFDDLVSTLGKIGFDVVEINEETFKMTQIEALRAMQACVKKSEDDPEDAHVNADNILLTLLASLGFQEVCEEFAKVRKWYA